MDTDAFDGDPQYSYFPVSSSHPTQGATFRTLPVNVDQIHNNIKDDIHELKSLLLRAWARTLHAYVRLHPVSFTILPSLLPSDAHGVSQDQSLPSGNYEVTLARYHVGSSSDGGAEGFNFSLRPGSEVRSNAGLIFSETDALPKETENEISGPKAANMIKLIEKVGLDILLYHHHVVYAISWHLTRLLLPCVLESSIEPKVLNLSESFKLIIDVVRCAFVYPQKAVADVLFVPTSFRFP